MNHYEIFKCGRFWQIRHRASGTETKWTRFHRKAVVVAFIAAVEKKFAVVNTERNGWRVADVMVAAGAKRWSRQWFRRNERTANK